MTPLIRLSADATPDEILDVIERDGAVIVERLIPEAQVERTLAELLPYVEATKPGADAFSGFRTTRTGALVARSPACRELVMHPAVLAAARRFLAPWCERVQLHLTQVIRIRPGQAAQPLHRDRWAWGTHLAHLEPQLNTIWALGDFTAENGATRVAPGSTRWPDERQPTEAEVTVAEMPRGSVLVYSGSVFHGGGENRADHDRFGLNLTYTLGWLRQEENQYLSCPPELARALEPELQDLLGYTLGSYALGYYTPPLPPGEGPELVSPARALGRGGDGAERLGSAELLDSLTSRLRAEGELPA
jgi:ectoine hydroxylase-related dioxygenase (phytanoyl-CoA dioxygenase family)